MCGSPYRAIELILLHVVAGVLKTFGSIDEFIKKTPDRMDQLTKEKNIKKVEERFGYF
jgi:acetylglutamate kinase